MMLQRTVPEQRSIDRTSDAGLTSQAPNDARAIQEVLTELRQMDRTPRLVTSPDDREAWERAMRRRTDRLGRL
jgi:hypothetical protein